MATYVCVGMSGGVNAQYWIASSNTLFECALNQINGISACDRQPLTALDV